MRKFLVLLTALLVSGCGVYTFNPRGSTDIQSVYVERFGNQTGEFGLSDRVTDLVIESFLADGTLKVVGEGQADAILSGELQRYEVAASVFDESDQVQRYKVVMQFSITLKKPAEEKPVFTEPISQEGTYEADTETEQDGQQRAIRSLVETILNRTTKSW